MYMFQARNRTNSRFQPWQKPQVAPSIADERGCPDQVALTFPQRWVGVFGSTTCSSHNGLGETCHGWCCCCCRRRQQPGTSDEDRLVSVQCGNIARYIRLFRLGETYWPNGDKYSQNCRLRHL